MTAALVETGQYEVTDTVAVSEPGIAVSIDGVSKTYGSGRDRLLAIERIDIEVQRGEFACIVGASGCGKSTLLSLIAGLDKPTAGSITLHDDGRPALMFQEPALLPWLTVADNVDLPLKLQRVDKAQRRERVQELLQLVHLEGFARKRPHELSGGMRQRVALARALAQTTRLLLMDEPFAALDAITRDTLHEDIARIHATTGITVVFVTHNVREAVRLGDRVVMLSSRPGRVVAEWDVEISGPRRIESPDVGALSVVITDRLREEIGRHGG
ncbi:MAG TPA: ABC transporter ATP-binding protein [Candidatus Dormibacteraeota bacterium]|jgi:NitT/TauT family transport system ATP-binding protein|nr:ABC transporter ATP-binding protein [Candidatus Dormibacteraeota bacterium]